MVYIELKEGFDFNKVAAAIELTTISHMTKRVMQVEVWMH